MLQSLAGAGAPLLPIEVPQSSQRVRLEGENTLQKKEQINIQHSSEYSTPARGYPAAEQASVQLSTLLLEAPPMGVVPMLRTLGFPSLFAESNRCVKDIITFKNRKRMNVRIAPQGLPRSNARDDFRWSRGGCATPVHVKEITGTTILTRIPGT